MIFAVCHRTKRQAVRDSYFWINPEKKGKTAEPGGERIRVLRGM